MNFKESKIANNIDAGTGRVKIPHKNTVAVREKTGVSSFMFFLEQWIVLKVFSKKTVLFNGIQ